MIVFKIKKNALEKFLFHKINIKLMETINKKQELIESFICIWREERCLWDVKSPSCKDRNEKNKSYEKFLKILFILPHLLILTRI